ncbi:MAG: ribbon-helix-helix domain-containing protein [Endomicrobium sp.]|nr:ribbon-helix-helix domain-containing protein [Endomicrobium sp.]
MRSKQFRKLHQCLNIYISEKHYTALMKLADSTGTSMSAIVRQLIAQHLLKWQLINDPLKELTLKSQQVVKSSP